MLQMSLAQLRYVHDYNHFSGAFGVNITRFASRKRPSPPGYVSEEWRRGSWRGEAGEAPHRLTSRATLPDHAQTSHSDLQPHLPHHHTHLHSFCDSTYSLLVSQAVGLHSTPTMAEPTPTNPPVSPDSGPSDPVLPQLPPGWIAQWDAA